MGIELFFRNLKYLFKYNLKHIAQHASSLHDTNLLEKVESIIDNYPFEEKTNENSNFINYINKKSQHQIPNILNCVDSIDLLINSNLSLCRFGDGELSLMHNRYSGLFQNWTPKLGNMLEEVLSSKDKNIAIGIFSYFYYSPQSLNTTQRIFFRSQGKTYRNILSKYINHDQTYLDACLSMPYHLFKNFNYQKYFSKFQELWNNKDIVIICGKTVFSRIEYNIFDSANSIEWIYGPRVNAFDSFDNLLDKALKTDKNKIKFIILGQTATVLSYVLAKKGHRAIDIGHIAKDYNSWRKQEIITHESVGKFYDKD